MTRIGRHPAQSCSSGLQTSYSPAALMSLMSAPCLCRCCTRPWTRCCSRMSGRAGMRLCSACGFRAQTWPALSSARLPIRRRSQAGRLRCQLQGHLLRFPYLDVAGACSQDAPPAPYPHPESIRSNAIMPSPATRASPAANCPDCSLSDCWVSSGWPKQRHDRASGVLEVLRSTHIRNFLLHKLLGHGPSIKNLC